jgi:hypothetical protein
VRRALKVPRSLSADEPQTIDFQVLDSASSNQCRAKSISVGCNHEDKSAGTPPKTLGIGMNSGMGLGCLFVPLPLAIALCSKESVTVAAAPQLGPKIHAKPGPSGADPRRSLIVLVSAYSGRDPHQGPPFFTLRRKALLSLSAQLPPRQRRGERFWSPPLRGYSTGGI